MNGSWVFLRNSNFWWQKCLTPGGFSPEPILVPYRIKKMSRTQCHKGLDLWSCNQLLVIQFCTSYWYLKVRSQFCIWFGKRVIVLRVKVRTNCIISKITAKIKFIRFGLWAHKSSLQYLWKEPLVCPVEFLFDPSQFWKLFPPWNIVLHNFSQFWIVLSSFGQEKQVYPSLSHFGWEKQVLDGKNPTLLPSNRHGLPSAGSNQGVQKFFSAAVHDLGIKIGRTLLHEKGVACNQYFLW